MSSRAVIKSLFIGPSRIPLFEIHRWRFVARADSNKLLFTRVKLSACRQEHASLACSCANQSRRFKFGLVDVVGWCSSVATMKPILSLQQCFASYCFFRIASGQYCVRSNSMGLRSARANNRWHQFSCEWLIALFRVWSRELWVKNKKEKKKQDKKHT